MAAIFRQVTRSASAVLRCHSRHDCRTCRCKRAAYLSLWGRTSIRSPEAVAGFCEFLCLDMTRYYNFPAQWIVCLRKLGYCLGSGNKTMSLPIASEPDLLFIGDSKVDASNWTLIS